VYDALETLRQVRAGSERARELLVNQYRPLVLKVCKEVKHPSGMEFGDWVQIGMLGLLKAVERFDPSRGCPFHHYARKAIRWALFEEWKKHGRNHEVLFSELPGGEPEEGVIETGLEERLVDRQFWKQVFHHCLSTKERRIVKLRIWEEMTFRDIGADTGLSHTQCQSIFDKSMQKLRSYLEQNGFDYTELSVFE
jgi:RNA polymerase sigma factor (sigma-70 family)